MTRRVTLLLVAATAATAAWAPPADAVRPQPTLRMHTAAFEPLTEARARKLALRLAVSVARERDVVAWHLSPAVKVRRTRIVFLYDDRNRDDVFCTAKVIVEQTARTRSVAFGAGRCAQVPAEALAIEKATNAVIRAVRAKVATVRKSIDAFERSLEPCEGLVVPRGRQADTEALVEAGQVVAIYDPVAAQLDGFVTKLQDIQPDDPDLVRGVVAWRRFLTVLSSIPRPASDACAAIRQWAAKSYAPEAAPADFDELRDLLDSLGRHERGILRASERLARLGVFPNTVLGFTPLGLVYRAAGVRVR